MMMISRRLVTHLAVGTATRGRAVSPSFTRGDLTECPLCLPYRSSCVTTRINPRLSGGLTGGGGMGAFSSSDAPTVRFIASMVNVLKSHNSGCNIVNNILCHCKKKTLPTATWIDIKMNPTYTLT
jgi:hypothetical protein